jgi:hypothetical protein
MRSGLIRRSVAIATTVLLLSTTAVFADDISNDLDASIDAVAEVMALDVGGPAGTTNLYVTPRNDDGKNGCNLTGSTTLVLAVASSNTSAATVSPSSVTFTSCGATPTLTVTPLAAGSTTISVSQTSNGTDGTFSLAPATFIVNVTSSAPVNTAPQVTISGVTAGASYEIGSEPTPMCSITDLEDGPSSFAATITGTLAYGLGTLTASCDYTDAGGLNVSASAMYSIVDTVDPLITLVSREPAANTNGWNNSDVTITWSCSDTGSGVLASQVTAILSTEGAGQSATGTCEDHAGNTASDTVADVNIDETSPSIADDGVASGAPGTNGWYISEVVNSFTASDGLSGVAGTNPILVGTGSAEGTGIIVNSGTVADLAGNSTAGIDSVPFKIDLSNPTDVAFSSVLSGSYYFGSVPAAPTCTANDGISGLASCQVTGYGTGVGSHTLTATATDNAGRTSIATTSYSVLAWTLTGFYSPVDMNGVVNTVKGGSTVPLKFEVFAGPTELTSVGSIASFKTATVACGTLATSSDEIEITSTGGTTLRYDSTAGQFIQNWQTPKGAGVCYRATMTTLDGSFLTAFFRTR